MRDLDIIGSHRDGDTALVEVVRALRSRLHSGDALMADSVSHMVTLVQDATAHGQLRRLRIFGHGNPGHQNVGRLEYSHTQVDGTFVLDERDRILIIHRDAAVLWNQYPLELMRRNFAPNGWVELHGCNVARGASGRALLRSLAWLWRVRILAGEGLQRSGGGFEGAVWAAEPPQANGNRVVMHPV